MRPTLTRKIFLGYLLMIGLVLAQGGYALFELNRLNRLSRSMVQGEVVAMDLEKKLIDLFLSEVGSEQKYLVVRDPDFLELARTKAAEFRRLLLRLAAGEREAEARARMEAIAAMHRAHVERFAAAAAGGTQAVGSEQGVRRITEALEKLVWDEEVSLARKMNRTRSFSQRGREITLVLAVLMTGLGLIMAWLVTRSVRGPVLRLQAGTRDVAQGIFDRKIEVTSADELGELARAFNAMTDRLAELEEMKREFISNLSHELRTPLTSIKAAANLMLDQIPGPVTDKQRRLLGIVQEETGKLVRMVNNLLDLSKIRAGMMHYHFTEGDVAPLLRAGVDHVRLLAELKGITLELDAPEGLPRLLMDREKIEQVVNNLLSNAVKFTPNRGRVSVWARTVDRAGAAAVRVTVEDTGPGIAAEALPAIFDRYRQAGQAGDEVVKGTGLGLAICKFYVEEHGGEIGAESEVGRGSRFWFELPAVPQGQGVPA